MKLSKELAAKIKGKEVWITSYNGHEIKVVNKMRTTMYIDGNEVAKQKGLISSNLILQSAIPETDKIVIAHIHQKNSADLVTACDFVIGEISPAKYGFQHKDGSVSLLTDDEMKQYLQYRKEEDEDTAVIVTTLLN